MSVGMVEEHLSDLLIESPNSLEDPDLPSTFRMLQHFQTCTSFTIGSTKCKRVMGTYCARESWEHPYLMHMVLAVAAAHLKRLHQEASQYDLHRQYAIAEAAHWEQGLQSHRKALGNIKPKFDAALATTFLCIIFTFSLDDDVPIDAYSGTDNDKFKHATDPMAAIGGFRALRQYYGETIDSWACPKTYLSI